MSTSPVTLNDKYTFDKGRVYLTGTQAILRMLMIQRRRDLAAGLNTAGFISGYRGSPMTVMDVELWRAADQIEKDHIRFWPATNEHMAATAVWGTQQVHYHNDANYDGVSAMWYGKGPGLDQSLDAMRQGNYHGTSKHGGVLVLAGDDPAMRSTVDPYHSELLFEDLLMPVLYPADIQEVFDLGLYGFELSRFSGCWVGYKLLPETIETAASIRGDHDHIRIVRPDFEFPPDGVNSRLRDMWSFQEIRMRQYKIPAAVAFARANKLNRISHDSRNARFGIAAMGKTWRDMLQALEDLGLDRGMLEALGIRILKVAMPWPVDRDTYAEFADGLDDILVIEDKREQIENALRDVCYAWPESRRPRIVGRRDESGQKLVDDVGDLSPDKIARVIAQRIGHIHDSERMRARIGFLDRMAEEATQRTALNMARLPYFCSGCPPSAAWAATSWPTGWNGTSTRTPRWAVKARHGSARRRSSRRRTRFSSSAMALTTTPASSQYARPSRPASTSPTRFFTTMLLR
jgi:indolepyruvate ferredoxin oxidoreductase